MKKENHKNSYREQESFEKSFVPTHLGLWVFISSWANLRLSAVLRCTIMQKLKKKNIFIIKVLSSILLGKNYMIRNVKNMFLL